MLFRSTKWKISQLALSLWDGWGYMNKEYRQAADERRGGPEKTTWRDDVPYVYMRFNTLTDSVIEPCEMVTMRWRAAGAQTAGGAQSVPTVNGLSAEQAQAISEASFMPGEANQKLRERTRMLAIGKGSAGNRITVEKKSLLEIAQEANEKNIITVLHPEK